MWYIWWQSFDPLVKYSTLKFSVQLDTRNKTVSKFLQKNLRYIILLCLKVSIMGINMWYHRFQRSEHSYIIFFIYSLSAIIKIVNRNLQNMKDRMLSMFLQALLIWTKPFEKNYFCGAFFCKHLTNRFIIPKSFYKKPQ